VVGENELHWDEHDGKQRLAEVTGRMQGPREPLEMLLGLHPVTQQPEASKQTEAPC
jgi:hypothetical protein